MTTILLVAHDGIGAFLEAGVERAGHPAIVEGIREAADVAFAAGVPLQRAGATDLEHQVALLRQQLQEKGLGFRSRSSDSSCKRKEVRYQQCWLDGSCLESY